MKRENGIQSPSSTMVRAMRSASSRECAAASGGGGGRWVSGATGNPSATLFGSLTSRAADYSMQLRAVLITGAAKRIGATIARTLHGAGANVVLHGHHSRAEAELVKATLEATRRGSCTIVQGDLLDLAALPRIVAEAERAF